MKPLLPSLFCCGLAFVALALSCARGGAQDDKKKGKDAVAGRTLAEITKALVAINAAPDKDLGAEAKERQLALQRLRSYRYLAGVAHDVVADEGLERYAVAAAKICARLGQLDHNPKNPGLGADEYKVAKMGAASSCLGVGLGGLASSVDAWMDDSDEANVDRLGHRRWCLSPAMKKTGFGRDGKFTAMYCIDMSRKAVPAYDYVSWPPRGLVPVEYFKSDHAWHVSPNAQKYKKMGDKALVKVYPLTGDEKGEELAITDRNVDTQYFGIPNCLVFRPAKVDVSAGKRYRVEVTGLETTAGKKAAAISYVVEFCTVAKK
jgi:hypothetical protein